MQHLIKLLSLMLGLTILSTQATYADKKEDYQKTYNYARAIELVNEEKNDEAMTFFKREISDHKDNGYALAWLASLQYQEGQNGEALNNINLALKYLNKKDDFYAFSLGLRSKVYEELNEDKSALADLNQCVKLFPKSLDSYRRRAEYYLDRDQYELANNDFIQMTKIEAGNASGYVGSGICLRNLKRYDESIAQYDYALKLNPKYARALAQRGYTHHLMTQYSEAADDVVKALDIDNDDVAFTLMSMVADSAFDAMDFKLKMQQMMDPTNPMWPYYRADIRANTERYPEAIEIFESCNKMQFSTTICRRIADCKEEMGDFEGALEAIDEGLTADSSSVRLCYEKATVLNELGRKEESIKEYTHVIELAPRWVMGYHKRGWVKDNFEDTDGAIEDYTMAIMVDDSYVYNYLCRGNMYARKGMHDLAKLDFEQVLKRDTVPAEYEAAFYAWHYLGDDEKAVAALDSTLTHDEKGNLYDAACLYSRMNNSEKALDYLRKALENGFCRFNHIDSDDDLDNIRELDEFKALIEEYKQKAHDKWGVVYTPEDESDTADYEQIVDEIPFSHEGGITKVRCKINDLPLHFVFDTGASEVSISTVEATFMLKNNYLSEKDITGKQYYMTADGNISEGTTILLRKVTFGNLELENVKASVSKSQKAPLLLGQTVLQRLGKIEIDNERNVLKVTQKKKK